MYSYYLVKQFGVTKDERDTLMRRVHHPVPKSPLPQPTSRWVFYSCVRGKCNIMHFLYSFFLTFDFETKLPLYLRNQWQWRRRCPITTDTAALHAQPYSSFVRLVDTHLPPLAVYTNNTRSLTPIAPAPFSNLSTASSTRRTMTTSSMMAMENWTRFNAETSISSSVN